MTWTQRLKASPRLRIAVLAVGAFVLYGGYAALANLGFGDPSQVVSAGLGQGAASATTTS